MKELLPFSATEGGSVIYKDVRAVSFNIYNIQLESSVTDSYNYADIIYLLDNASETDQFIIKLQSYGGDCHGCIALVNTMKNTQGRVICEVLGPCYSAGSTIALAGQSLVMHPNSMLMFHDFSTTSRGKSSEIDLDLEHSKRWIHGYMLENHRPFLTKKECNIINGGKDFYIHADDPTLDKRIERHFKGLDKSIEVQL